MMRLTLILFLVTVSCTEDDPKPQVPLREKSMKQFQQDVRIPKPLWHEFEKIYRPLALDAEAADVVTDENADKKIVSLLKRRPPTDPLPFNVYLVEKTPGVLGGENFELKYPPGGGYLDYRNFLDPDLDGTFFLKVVYGKEMNPDETKVFYLSNAKERKVPGKALGNGCKRYFDISKYWKEVMDGNGLMLNSVDGRHVSLTAGTIFFVAPHEGKLRTAHLVLKDTSNRQLMCRPVD